MLPEKELRFLAAELYEAGVESVFMIEPKLASVRVHYGTAGDELGEEWSPSFKVPMISCQLRRVVDEDSALLYHEPLVERLNQLLA